jgi:hypothetical protein
MNWNRKNHKQAINKRNTKQAMPTTPKRSLMIKQKTVSIKKTSAPPQELILAKRGIINRLFAKGSLPSLRNKNALAKLQQQQGMEKKMERAFRRMHHELNQREHKMELRLQEVTLQNHALKKRRKFLLPMLFAAALAGGYMLFVLTNMQNSMAGMGGDINTMNGHMQDMSGNTASMNQSMQTLNENVESMNGNVKQMSDSIQPIGEVANTATPFTKAFRNLMPF